MNLLRRSILAALLTVSFSAVAQQSTPYTASFTQQAPAAAPQDSAAAPRILKIDPPNWWAQMPKPMLLVRGENLTSAKVRLSDPHLKIESTRISENGHWA